MRLKTSGASRSLQKWMTERAAKLDEFASAHVKVGGTGRGRRWATQQLNQAYAVLLSAQFQGFCRDLHAEAVDGLGNLIPSPELRGIFIRSLTEGRFIDRGNPNPGNLGADFGRLGLSFWDKLKKDDPRNAGRQKQLERLNEWRNAIAHQSFHPSKLGGRTELRLGEVQRWRSACNALAWSFERVLAKHLLEGHKIRAW